MPERPTLGDLKPYPEYKESGLPWLGRIPAHWTLRRAKYLYREVDERSQTGEEELCSVSHKTGVTPRKENVTMFMAESTVGYKICRPNDLAINTLWAWMAALGVARQVGVVSPAYGVYRPLPGSELLPDFADRLLRIEEYKSEYIARSTGVNASRLRLYPDQFLRIPVLLPTREEQEQIARYLEGMDRSVRRFIRNRRRLIEVLNEQKQAIINRAVTRGLDPNVPLKPSGVEWLGEIPAHWVSRRLKFLVQNVNEQTATRQPNEVYIALEHVEGWTGRVTLPSEDIAFDSQVKRFRAGDVLFGKLRPYLAKVTRPSIPGVCVGEFLVLRVKDAALRPEYLEQELRSKQFIDIINSSTCGAKMPRADWTFIGNLLIVYPPTEVEQQEIVSAIGRQTQALQSSIDRAKREIDLVREYRTRLIADVVTGKVDVRHLAPTEPLPAEPEADIEDETTPEDTETEPGEEAANDVD